MKNSIYETVELAFYNFLFNYLFERLQDSWNFRKRSENIKVATLVMLVFLHATESLNA